MNHQTKYNNDIYVSKNENNIYAVKYDISIPGKYSLSKRLSRNNYFKCYIKSVVIHIKLPSNEHSCLINE